ncbi:hypothetical protein ACFWNK_12280 [Streptomyces sp. NPDC058417]|uniref:hypothetical protein n=1 Tax=unclassified Streptomyces TaxID=2593676 RepID=UPI003659EF67
MLDAQTASAQNLAESALAIAQWHDTRSLYLSPGLGAVFTRASQLAWLATRAADHLICASDIISRTADGLPVDLGDDSLGVVTGHEAREAARAHFTSAARLTALGGPDAVAAAELLISDFRRHGWIPDHQPLAHSPLQNTALRAIAVGDATIARGKPWLSLRDTRVSIRISTIRALESRGLVAREPHPGWFHDERLHLTAAGRRDLAASFAHSRPTAPHTTTPAAARPKAAASRVR